MSNREQPSPELRGNWRRNWLSSIRELSDLDWQRQLWGKSSNPHHSYEEYVVTYFDDVVLDGYPERVAEGLMSTEEAEAVAPLLARIEAYREPGALTDDAAVLADPAWADVVASAVAARTTLLQTITDPNERRELLREEHEFP